MMHDGSIWQPMISICFTEVHVNVSDVYASKLRQYALGIPTLHAVFSDDVSGHISTIP